VLLFQRVVHSEVDKSLWGILNTLLCYQKGFALGRIRIFYFGLDVCKDARFFAELLSFLTDVSDRGACYINSVILLKEYSYIILFFCIIWV